MEYLHTYGVVLACAAAVYAVMQLVDTRWFAQRRRFCAFVRSTWPVNRAGCAACFVWPCR